MLAKTIKLVTIATCLTGSATADFHLMYGINNYAGVETYKYFSCPSNYYNSKCWCDGDRKGTPDLFDTPQPQDNGEYKLRLENVCGVAEMDLWWRPNGISGDDRVRYEAYIPNADGHVVATCYDNGGQAVDGPDCITWFPALRNTVHDGFVCYSEICGHA